jgi:hypothetical protein
MIGDPMLPPNENGWRLGDNGRLNFKINLLCYYEQSDWLKNGIARICKIIKHL